MGMKLLVKTSEFAELNIGFTLDEGIASATEVFPVFYGERTAWSKSIVINRFCSKNKILHIKRSNSNATEHLVMDRCYSRTLPPKSYSTA